ncbi:MAG: hypothetical protein LBB49_02315 [Gracilibacteraceae bacterium]|jgi:hypothetical protein|nr:hypothetical protein [Gracilibacteraceae bacterium]
MAKLADLNAYRVLNDIEDLRKNIRPIELFHIIAPVTLHILRSIEPEDEFADEHRAYIETLEQEMAAPVIDVLKNSLDLLEKICRETPTAVPAAIAVLSQDTAVQQIFRYYDKLIYDRIRILKRAEREGKRITQELPPLPPMPEKDISEREEASVVSRLDVKRVRTELDRLQKAAGRFGFYTKILARNLDLVSKNHGYAELIPELAFLARYADESGRLILQGTRNIGVLAERTIDVLNNLPFDRIDTDGDN